MSTLSQSQIDSLNEQVSNLKQSFDGSLNGIAQLYNRAISLNANVPMIRETNGRIYDLSQIVNSGLNKTTKFMQSVNSETLIGVTAELNTLVTIKQNYTDIIENVKKMYNQLIQYSEQITFTQQVNGQIYNHYLIFLVNISSIIDTLINYQYHLAGQPTD